MNAISEINGITIEKNGIEIFLDSSERAQLLDHLLDGPYRSMFTMRVEEESQIEYAPCANGIQLVIRSGNKHDRAALLSLSPDAVGKLHSISGAATS